MPWTIEGIRSLAAVAAKLRAARLPPSPRLPVSPSPRLPVPAFDQGLKIIAEVSEDIGEGMV